MACDGNSADHCCYIKGVRCPHSIDNYTDATGHFRRWACGLYAALGNWDAVLASDEYRRDVAPTFERIGINCRDYACVPSQPCNQCGAFK